jgi:Iron dependent repressor, N-terminal DNA binding domain
VTGALANSRRSLRVRGASSRGPGNGASRGPSEVVSHYLEAIYYVWTEGEPLRSARLADWLSVSRPTVTVALRRMTRDGMVRLNARKEVELTAKAGASRRRSSGGIGSWSAG